MPGTHPFCTILTPLARTTRTQPPSFPCPFAASGTRQHQPHWHSACSVLGAQIAGGGYGPPLLCGLTKILKPQGSPPSLAALLLLLLQINRHCMGASASYGRCRFSVATCVCVHVLQVLSLRNTKLQGSLPAEVSLLSRLNVSGRPMPCLSGPMPCLSSAHLASSDSCSAPPGCWDWWAQARTCINSLRPSQPALHLQVLDLAGAGLSGSLPPELGLLTGLEVLDLSGNGFSGPLPDTWSMLTGLRVRLMGAAAWGEGAGRGFI